MEKRCKLCGKTKPLEKFPTNRGRADGHLDTCLKCWEKFTTEKNRVIAIAERRDMNREDTPTIEPIEVIIPSEVVKVEKPKKPISAEALERRRASRRRYYDKNKEKYRAWGKRYRATENGKARKKASDSKYYAKVKADPELYAIYAAKSRERKQKMSEEARERKRASDREKYHAKKRAREMVGSSIG